MTKYGENHPEYAEAWDWDEPGEGGNIDELADHQITRSEVEQVWGNGPAWAKNKNEASGDFKMMGRTNGGRRLTIIVSWSEIFRSLRPVTGWDATAGERKQYFDRG